MALKNENRVSKPLYVQDSSKIYEKANEEEKIRKILKDKKQRQIYSQVNTTNNKKTGCFDNINTSRIINDQSTI